MKKSQAKLLLALLLCIYLIIIWIYDLDSKTYKQDIVLGILATFIIAILIDILQNIKILSIYFLSKIIYRKYKVRFSISYLFIIKNDDKYLLVYNKNRKNYQLVGGVYKKFPEANVLFNQLNVTADKVLGINAEKKDDLRIFMPIKNASKFIKWFLSEKEREISPCREFYEELIKTKFFSQNLFLYINYKKVDTIITSIQHKEQNNWKYKQIQIFDIFELLPNEEQKKEIQKLSHTDIIEIQWATENLINNNGFDSQKHKKLFHIGEHTKWAINRKYIK